jgi:hypothetical protein
VAFRIEAEDRRDLAVVAGLRVLLEAGDRITTKEAPAAPPVKVQMMGMLGKLAITPMGFLAAGYSVLAWEGRVLEEEIANTMGFITVGILAETMATMVTIMLAASQQIVIHLLGMDIVMAGMLLVLLGSPSFNSGWSRR